MQENAKLEGQHFKLQPSLKVERQESLVVVGSATHELVEIFVVPFFGALASIFRIS